MTHAKHIFLFAIVIRSAYFFAQAQNPPVASPEWKATIKVVDEAGQPIQGADVAIWHYVTPTNGESEASEKIAGLTDADGIFTGSAHSRSVSLAFIASYSGYYQTTRGYELGFAMNYDSVKWNPHPILVLKKVGEPIAMYAKRIHDGPPVQKQAVGYDFTIGDWVAPYGKGQHANIFFKKEFSGKSPYDYDDRLTITFPNPGDGIQKLEGQGPLNEGSFLKSPHEAPSDGYQPQFLKEEGAHPGMSRKEPDNDPKRIYIFRVQSFLDQNGNVKSALYGKIYGDFMEFSYYLNPTPNSRNLEFDPKQNLLEGLKSIDRVTAP